MDYISKPHKIRAFHFNSPNISLPLWFMEAYKRGKTQMTINEKNQYITIYNDKLNIENAFIGDWVCINTQGKIYRISNKEFEEAYEAGV